MTGRANLSTREKRAWSRKLLEAQEAVEAAVDGRNKIMAEALSAGVAYAVIETSTGLGPQTVRNSIDDAGRAGQGQ